MVLKYKRGEVTRHKTVEKKLLSILLHLSSLPKMPMPSVLHASPHLHHNNLPPVPGLLLQLQVSHKEIPYWSQLMTLL